MIDILLLLALWFGGIWFLGETIHTMSKDRE